MSKFFVGQRVRVVRCVVFPEMIGMEARVTGLDVPAKNWRTRQVHYGLISLSIKTPRGNFGCASEDQIEPILPEGAAPSEFTFQQLMDELKRIEA